MGTRKIRLRPNEEPETIADYQQQRPNHTTTDWIEEALYIAGQHCGDDDRSVCNFLYCALDLLRSNTLKSEDKNRG